MDCRDNVHVPEAASIKVSLEMKDYLADFIVGVYKEAKLQRLYPWQVHTSALAEKIISWYSLLLAC